MIRIMLLLLLVSAGTTAANKTYAQAANVNFSVFYNSLKPYGRWVNNATYGQVWISNQSGFTPYSTGGHWAYTDYGWTWVSDYDWGWAPFHYGRWAYEPAEGWFWVPAYEWAPAWVAWRGGGDYYGWAPLSPGLNVNVSFGTIPADRWVFAPRQYITRPDINRYYAPRNNNVTIIKNTTVVNNVTVRNNVHYVAGPRKQDVEKANHTTIQTYKVANSSRPGKTEVNNTTVNIYRPVINNNSKTVVNKNSNNTTVNKNSNNTTQKTNNSNNKTTINNNLPASKPDAQQTPAKKPQVNKPDAGNTLQSKPANNNRKQPPTPKRTVKPQQQQKKQPAQQQPAPRKNKQPNGR